MRVIVKRSKKDKGVDEVGGGDESVGEELGWSCDGGI